MNSAKAILVAVQAINTLLTLRRELGAAFGQVDTIIRQAEAEGREVTADDLVEVQEANQEARDALRAEIERQR